MEKLIYAKRINDSQLTGLVDVSTNPPKVYCYCSEEVANVILKNKTKSEKWAELDEEIGKFYENDTDDDDNEDDEENEDDESEGNLIDIGEVAAMAFGYI